MKVKNRFIFACTAIISCMLTHNTINSMAPDFTVEWHELTTETWPTKAPILEQLEPVVVEAMTPVCKSIFIASEPRIAAMPATAKELLAPKITAGIASGCHSEWQKKTKNLYEGLATKQIAAAYLAVAKDIEKNPIGCVLFRKENIRDSVTSSLESVTEGSLDAIDAPAEESLYGCQLAVKPEMQKKGIGKALVSCITEHLPSVNTIYFRILAHPCNKYAKNFYEHFGCKHVLTGRFASESAEPSFIKNKSLYVYKR